MRAILLAIMLLLAAAPAAASHLPWCRPSTSDPEIDTGPGAARFYLDNDVVMEGWSIWLYMESNGVDGLQRHDETHDDTCGHPERGDTIIF